MSITKEELIALADKGYQEFEERLMKESSSKILAEYYNNLSDIKDIADSWDLVMRDIYEADSTLCNEIRLTAKEYELEDSFEFAKACIAHKLV